MIALRNLTMDFSGLLTRVTLVVVVEGVRWFGQELWFAAVFSHLKGNQLRHSRCPSADPA